MSIRARSLSLAVVLLLPTLIFGVVPAAAQVPDEFTNLKVLPKDIDKRELVSIMREFAGALGTRCNHCHVGEDPNSLDTFDFASDEMEEKRVARAMMTMTSEINKKLLPATGRKQLTQVQCATCHRGLRDPESLDRILMSVVDTDGVDAALARYRELREEYYGTGAYDFSPKTLNLLAETLADERKDLDGALATTKLNVELHPDEAYPHLILGQIFSVKGDKAAARASLERCLELEPDNRWARRMLERMGPSE